MSLTFLALATRTSWSAPLSRRLTHGEWVPVSIATRIVCEPEKRLWKAFRVVGMRLYLEYLAAIGVQETQMTVTITEIDTGRDGAMVGHGRSPPFCEPAVGLRLPIGHRSLRGAIWAFSSHLR